jgi:hypothetical protein
LRAASHSSRLTIFGGFTFLSFRLPYETALSFRNRLGEFRI